MQKYGVSTEEIEVDYEEFRSELMKSGSLESVASTLPFSPACWAGRSRPRIAMLKFGHFAVLPAVNHP